MTERMSDERLDQEIRRFLAWEAEDVAGAPSAAHMAKRIGDRAGMAPTGLRLTPRLVWVLLAGLLVIALLGALVASASRPPAPPLAVTDDVSPPAPSASTSSPAISPAPTPVAWPSLPALRFPLTVASAPGDYGWEGSPATKRGMHNVVGGGERALTFAVGGGCLGADQGHKAVPVRVAGFDGVSIEPYLPVVTFGAMAEGSITRAYALTVGDRTLCVFLSWDPATTDEERDRLLKIPQTLRAIPIGDERIRIVFTLDADWDIG